ncbi:MAG: hypothetical protein H0X62_04055 [Bacteroidetes bacterium]|nr:hypothetical protein [Bacteroidota bacterium]
MKLFLITFLTIAAVACNPSKEAGTNANQANRDTGIPHQNHPIQGEIQEGAPEVAQDDTPEGVAKHLQHLGFKRATQSNDVLATLERTPCYGTCPIYKLMILKTGRAVYEGVDHVDKIGRFTTNFSKAEMDAILRKAEEVGYWEMQDEYDSPITDFPTTITSVRKGSKAKSIHNRVDGPASLAGFEKFMDEMLSQKELNPLEEK